MSNIFQQRYYKINKFLLTAIGQWPYQSRGRRFTILVIFIFLAMSQIIPQIIAVVEFRQQRDIVLESLPPFVIDIACAIKLTAIVVNMDKMLAICEHIEIDWLALAQQPEIHMLHEYAETGRQFTIVYARVYVVTGLFMGQPVLPKILEVIKPTNSSEPAQYPFPVDYYGIDMETYYFYMLLHSFVCVTAILTVVVAADTFFIVQVQHNCAMFTIVGRQMQRMTDGIPGDWELHYQSTMDPSFRHLAICIENHTEVIKFSELLETCYSRAFFVIVGVNMIVISITGFQTVMIMNEKPQEAVRYAAFTIAQLMHLFLLCFFSQRLMDHSQQVCEDLYQSEWHRSTLCVQKLLGLVSIRSHIPCQLTAGKFLVMSLENFTAVVKSSMTYFTLLRSLQ